MTENTATNEVMDGAIYSEEAEDELLINIMRSPDEYDRQMAVADYKEYMTQFQM